MVHHNLQLAEGKKTARGLRNWVLPKSNRSLQCRNVWRFCLKWWVCLETVYEFVPAFERYQVSRPRYLLQLPHQLFVITLFHNNNDNRASVNDYIHIFAAYRYTHDRTPNKTAASDAQIYESVNAFCTWLCPVETASLFSKHKLYTVSDQQTHHL